MGIFSGYLLCCDIDGTLIDDERKIPKENILAIEYFKKEGGIFTIASGRSPVSISRFFKDLTPDCAMIVNNGAGIYDVEKSKFLWNEYLPDDSIEVIEFVGKNCPYSGIEIYKDENIYFCKYNDYIHKHIKNESLPVLDADYRTLPKPWSKALFAQKPDEVLKIKKALLNSGFAHKYSFVQSSSEYFEVLSLKASKGNALKALCNVLGMDIKKTIAVGDNENDLSMIMMSGYGFTVENAHEEVKRQSPYVVGSNNSGCIRDVVEKMREILTKI